MAKVKHPDGSICKEGTKKVPPKKKKWKPCCDAFDSHTTSCIYDIRFEYHKDQWGIMVCDGGSSRILISYCPHCGEKL